MIIDLTDKFRQLYGTQTFSNNSNWNSSIFMKSSISYLYDLNILESKLLDLQKNIKSGSRFDKEVQTKKIMNVKQNIKLSEQNIKKLKSAAIDIKGTRSISQKLKDSILISMEMRLLQFTFKFKDLHLLYANKGKKVSNNEGEDKMKRSSPVKNNEADKQINLDRSHFIQQSQEELINQIATQEYKEIEKSIHQISEMYRETISVVRMHELMIDTIEGNIDETDTYIHGGKRNLTELNNKQQKNRSFIIKIFTIQYIVVFIYIVLLS